MGYNIYPLLDKRSQNEDGTFPVILRLLVNRKSTSINQNIDLFEHEWDETNKRIKTSVKRFENITRLNKGILSKVSKYMDLLFQMEENGILNTRSIKEIKKLLLNNGTDISKIQNKGTEISLESAIREQIENFRTMKKHGSASAAEHIWSFCKNYAPKTNLLLREINYQWLKDTEIKYLSKGLSVNGLSVHLRGLRTILLNNIKAGRLSKDTYAFENYKIKSEATQKRALRGADFDTFFNADITQYSFRLQRAHQYFKISYYLLGMNYSDMAHLKLENIDNGRIKYKRIKSKRLYDIKISEKLKVLLEPFLLGKGQDDYIFDIASKDVDELVQYKRIKQKLKRHNEALKELAQLLGINSQKLTTYVARHSFATNARGMDIDIPIISQLMGHEDIKTTSIYLDSIENQAIDKAIDKIFE